MQHSTAGSPFDRGLRVRIYVLARKRTAGTFKRIFRSRSMGGIVPR